MGDLEQYLSEKVSGMRLDAASAAYAMETLGASEDDLLSALLPLAAVHAVTPISDFAVGAVGRGGTGTYFMGTNVEFAGLPMNQTIHAEQFVFTHARLAGEKALELMATSATPCGHCRQFLYEANTSMSLWENGVRRALPELLPEAFGPVDLGVEGNSLQASGWRDEDTVAHADDPLVRTALEAARASWSPYSKSPAGIALQLVSGEVVHGSYVENAAYNPSLLPLQGALIHAISSGLDPSELGAAVLVERRDAPISHQAQAELALSKIAPRVHLQHVTP